MKKTVSALLAGVMLVSLLTACAGSSSTASSGGQDAVKGDTDTVAVSAVVIARDDVSEDDVYSFVSTIYENVDKITEQHSKGAELNLEFASAVTSVPYHPGAAKYFAEKGYNVASVKDNAGAGSSAALTFTTGSDTGTYYGYGGVLSSFISAMSGLDVSVVSSGGSQVNIEEMMAGNAQLGFVQSDVMAYAYNGERLFSEKIDGFSVVAQLYLEQVQIVATNPEIKTVADLKGKSVSIGASGSGVYFNAIDVLESYGMTESDIKPVFQNFGDSAESLKDGKIDAAFIVAGIPTTAIVDLAAAKPVYLVGLDEEHISELLKSSPYYTKYTIPANTY